jgi:hypothetical protein
MKYAIVKVLVKSLVAWLVFTFIVIAGWELYVYIRPLEIFSTFGYIGYAFALGSIASLAAAKWLE